MNLLKRITYNPFLPILIGFIFLHLFLFNINVAEWGDSYRFLRAAEFIRKGAYPQDEKRPPLFSLILSLRPDSVDQIFFGRVVVFVFSVACFVVFAKLLDYFISGGLYKALALLFFTLNPVFLYWSIRIMSDLIFSFFVLLALFLLTKWKEDLGVIKALILGLLSGLAVLTRFEGYFLFVSLLLGILFGEGISLISDISLKRLLIKAKALSMCFVAFLFIVIPDLIFRNPLGSKYLGEVSGRMYDLKMLWIYIASLLFIFGIVPAFFFVARNFKGAMDTLRKNVGIASFLFFELLVILLWPAAIPRLFMAIIPFLIILLVLSVENYFSSPKKDLWTDTFWLIVILGFYILSQYLLRLQSLISVKGIFVLVLLLQIFVGVSTIFKKLNLFIAFTVVSMFIWALAVIWVHKDIFISVKNAAEYGASNLSGRVAYNDVSSVSDWYLNYRYKNPSTFGFYYNSESKKNMEYNSLLAKNIDYLLLTNEHNTTMELDISKRPYLMEIKEFRYNVNGKEFFAKIVKFNRGN